MIYPKHIALIPDGNRTWAKEKWIHQMLWHIEWFNRVVESAKYVFANTPIEVFTCWWLSTENLTNRSEEELEYLFNLYKKLHSDMDEFLKEHQINFKWAWSSNRLPDHLVEFLRSKEKELSFDTNKYFVLAINYWWRDEILRWINRLIEDWKSKIETEKDLNDYLDFWKFPNVELVIRTKGDMARRLSWFMLWWIGYAELYFTKIKCPDFTIDELQTALARFDEVSNERNFWK